MWAGIFNKMYKKQVRLHSKTVSTTLMLWVAFSYHLHNVYILHFALKEHIFILILEARV